MRRPAHRSAAASLFCFLITFICPFLLVFNAYKQFPEEGLAAPLVEWDDMILQTVCSLTEPDRINVFPEISGGLKQSTVVCGKHLLCHMYVIYR